ncbi:DinB family protein [Nocardioides insulae]|uniref:DinB family protein n=1 Tax=Nocardioides insulae TaxID=394734 RepID=UPI0004146B41|nr:DinB family protein [Nocardioides insulae]
MEALTASERDSLEAMVDAQRSAIDALLDDITEDEARARLVPSLTTVLGLVKHATFVERVWFDHRLGGRTRKELDLPETVDESFVLEPTDTRESVLATYRAACERSRALVAGRDLDELLDWRGTPVSLRWTLLHMIRELARHAGHGDILVEQLHERRSHRS